MKLNPRDVYQVIRVQLGASEVRGEDDLIEDLGAESMDMVNITVALEERYRVRFGEDELLDIRSVDDLVRLIDTQLQLQSGPDQSTPGP